MVPIDITQPTADAWIAVTDVAEVALEDGHIGGIEADHRRVESDIGLGEMLPEEKRLVRRVCEMLLNAVQRREKRVDVGIVCLLGGGEADLVDAIVDSVVDPVIHGINLGSKAFRIEPTPKLVDFAMLRVEKGVERGVEHANDFGGFIINNGVLLLVPKGRDCVAAFVVRVGFQV